MATKKENAVFMVRLKPRNPKRGIRLRSYHVFGYRFEEASGWYKVNQFTTDYNHKTGTRSQVDLVAYLREVRQYSEDQDSKLAFDVCTIEEAAAVDEREEQERVKRATASDHARGRSAHPNDLTSRETRRGSTDDGDASARRRARATATSAKSDDADGEGEGFDPDEDLGAPNNG